MHNMTLRDRAGQGRQPQNSAIQLSPPRVLYVLTATSGFRPFALHNFAVGATVSSAADAFDEIRKTLQFY